MSEISNHAIEPARRTGPLHPALRGVRAVLFDMGGTLTHPDWERLALLARRESCGEFSPVDLARAFGDGMIEVDACFRSGAKPPVDTTRRHWTLRRMYGALGVGEEACERLCAHIDGAHAERHIWCGVDADAPRVLAALRSAGLHTGVISNTEDGRLAELLQTTGLDAYFECALDSAVVGVRKPDPAIFRLALARLGVGAQEAAFVGDSYAHDALAARAAGLRPVLIDPRDLHPEAECARIRRLSELIGEEAAA